MSLLSKSIVGLGGVALVLSTMTVGATAQAKTASPPCTKKAAKSAVVKSGVIVTWISKPTCKKKNGKRWAAVSFTIDDMDDAAALLRAKGKKWKVVGAKREAKLCSPSNNKLPKKVKKRACVS